MKFNGLTGVNDKNLDPMPSNSGLTLRLRIGLINNEAQKESNTRKCDWSLTPAKLNRVIDVDTVKMRTAALNSFV